MFNRLLNLWKLSAFEPRTIGSEPVTDGTIVAQIVQKPQGKAVFIPHIKIDPIKEITEETT